MRFEARRSPDAYSTSGYLGPGSGVTVNSTRSSAFPQVRRLRSWGKALALAHCRSEGFPVLGDILRRPTFRRCGTGRANAAFMRAVVAEQSVCHLSAALASMFFSPQCHDVRLHAPMLLGRAWRSMKIRRKLAHKAAAYLGSSPRGFLVGYQVSVHERLDSPNQKPSIAVLAFRSPDS